MLCRSSEYKIAFLWPEIPEYCVRQINGLANQPLSTFLFGTRPKVPLKNLEDLSIKGIHWLEQDTKSLDQNFDAIFTGNIKHQPFRAILEQQKAFKPKLILLSDHSNASTVKKYLYDRWFFRQQHSFSAVLVPGRAGKTYATSIGFPGNRVFTGLYGADPLLFRSCVPLQNRPKRFLFVGQLIKRKKVLELCNAFLSVFDDMPQWELHLYGEGNLHEHLPHHPSIYIHNFAQPSQIAKIMNQSRVLFLPSSKEHWGLVVHEATLSGMALGLSDQIGAAEDLAEEDNAIIFKPRTPDIGRTMLRFARWNHEKWDVAEKRSLQLSQKFGPERFANTVYDIVKKIQQ